MKILIVDWGGQDSAARQQCFARAGHVVTAIAAADDAIAAAELDHDALVLACRDAGSATLARLRSLRAAARNTPLLVIADGLDSAAAVSLIDAGADDVLAARSAPQGQLAHIVALVRRANGHCRSRITIGALEVDLGKAQCWLLGRQIALSPMEYRLVEALALRRNQPVTRAQLLQLLHGHDDEPFAKSIDRLVFNIRVKFTGVTRTPYLHTLNRAYLLGERPGAVGLAAAA